MAQRVLSTTGESLYSTLGVPKTANAQEIRDAYERLASMYDPAKNPKNAAEAEVKLAEVARAYAILSNPVKRKRYNMWGSLGVQCAEECERRGFVHITMREGKPQPCLRCLLWLCFVPTCCYCCLCCCLCCCGCCGRLTLPEEAEGEPGHDQVIVAQPTTAQ